MKTVANAPKRKLAKPALWKSHPGSHEAAAIVGADRVGQLEDVYPEVTPAQLKRARRIFANEERRRLAYMRQLDAWEKRKNPATASAKAFEDFHGYEPTERITVKQEVHHHKHLAAAGELVGLQVKTLKGDVRKIEGLGKALLCFNEKMNQLFIRGGDQFLSPAELKKFGADGGHELETLGQIVGVGYFTNKTHLGDEGGEAIYSHKFRTTNEAGRHVTVTIARYPWLNYRVLDQQLEISGGSYTIRAEGIDK